MNFLKRLFGGTPDPTEAWPVLPVTTPSIDLRTMTFGPLRFGMTLEELKTLGRPAKYKHYNATTGDLLYAQAGFEVQMEEGRFVFIQYFTGRDAMTDAEPGMVLAAPTVILPDGSSLPISAGTKGEALVEIFGTPEGAEMGEEGSVLTWDRGEVTIEAELDEHTRVVRLNLFLTN